MYGALRYVSKPRRAIDAVIAHVSRLATAAAAASD